MKRHVFAVKHLVVLVVGSICTGGFCQDANILHPVAVIEQKLKYEDFDIVTMRDARFPGDIVNRAVLRWQDGTNIQVKWKTAPPGGDQSNNAPRYEIAAYEIQKLFLSEPEYVVPPTVGRCMTLAEYSEHEIEIQIYPTFGDSTVFFVLQYWLEQVTNDDVYDKDRFKRDSTYARHLANMNIFSYLIYHNDSNIGNFLLSTAPGNPRVFVPDNGIAFRSPESRRGHYWRDIRFKELPEKTIARLREIDKADLEDALGVVAQFEWQGNCLIPVEPTASLDAEKGLRITDEIVQFGLTQGEIDDIYRRLEELLERVDKGKFKLY